MVMTKRVGLDRICLKSMHLPLDAKPDQITAVVDKVKRAGLILYGGGVISMKTERDIVQAFEYAKAAGMHTITAAPIPDVLPILDQRIKDYDIVVAIHNHGPGDRHFPTPQSVYDAVKSLDHRIGLCIDIGHTVRIGADLLGSVRQLWGPPLRPAHQGRDGGDPARPRGAARPWNHRLPRPGAGLDRSEVQRSGGF